MNKIKKYQSIISVIYLLNIPISYVLLRCGYPPEVTMYVNIALVMISFTPRLLICKKYYSLSIQDYMKSVFLKSLLVTAICFTANYYLLRMFDRNNVICLCISCFAILVITGLVILLIGMQKSERQLIANKIKSIIHR